MLKYHARFEAGTPGNLEHLLRTYGEGSGEEGRHAMYEAILFVVGE